MPTDKEILDAAVAATENEIMGAAFDKEETVLDESGDRSLEEIGSGLEGQHEPEDDEEAEDEESEEESETEGEEGEGNSEQVAAEGEGEKPKPKEKSAAGEEKQKPEGRVPAGRLREQTEKARAAEAERDALKAQLDSEKAEAKKQIDSLNAKFDGFLAALQRQQQPAQLQPKVEEKPDAPPDLFEDPKGFAEYIQKGPQTALQNMERRLEELRIDNSMRVAHVKHGDAFGAAYQALTTLDRNNPENLAVGLRILKSPDPGEAMVQWHKRNEVLRQVGDDPAKYREQVADETRRALMADPAFRKQLLDDLRAEAETGEGGRPRTITKLPKSLNGASGSNRGGEYSPLDNSDRAIFDSALST